MSALALSIISIWGTCECGERVGSGIWGKGMEACPLPNSTLRPSINPIFSHGREKGTHSLKLLHHFVSLCVCRKRERVKISTVVITVHFLKFLKLEVCMSLNIYLAFACQLKNIAHTQAKVKRVHIFYADKNIKPSKSLLSYPNCDEFSPQHLFLSTMMPVKHDSK